MRYSNANRGWRPRQTSSMTSTSLAFARQAVDFFLVGLGQFLDRLLGLVAIVLAHLLGLLRLVGGLVAVAADIANRDPRFFGQLFDAADHLPPGLGGQRRDVDANQPAIVLRVEPQIAGDNRLLDVLQGAGIEGADYDLRRLGHADRSQLLDGRGRAIAVHAQRVDQAGIGPAGADAGETVLQHGNGLVHAFFDIKQDFFRIHLAAPSGRFSDGDRQSRRRSIWRRFAYRSFRRSRRD